MYTYTYLSFILKWLDLVHTTAQKFHKLQVSPGTHTEMKPMYFCHACIWQVSLWSWSLCLALHSWTYMLRSPSPFIAKYLTQWLDISVGGTMNAFWLQCTVVSLMDSTMWVPLHSGQFSITELFQKRASNLKMKDPPRNNILSNYLMLPEQLEVGQILDFPFTVLMRLCDCAISVCCVQ